MADINLQFALNGASFTGDLFRLLAAGGVKQNIIFSPFSIQTCVALAFAGAEGETAEEIVKGMKFVSSTPAEVAKSFQNVLDQYKDSELLKIANKVYVQQGKQLKDHYVQTTKKNYHAESEELNFSESAAAAETINSWVAAKTANKIKQLVNADAFSEDTRLVLLNALYFKGDWEKKFNEDATSEDDFHVGQEETVKVQFMHQKAKFNYGFFEDLDCTAIEMPYKNSDLSMFVLLPNEVKGLRPLAEKLKTINLVDLASKMITEEVVVKFPKFKVDFSVELTEPLKKLGIQKMFTESAEFSQMLESSENIFVSKVLHKACIEVNEEGSEAAAATGMIMMTRCLMVPIQFEADRPFLYMIWNKKNILFAGAFVTAPSS